MNKSIILVALFVCCLFAVANALTDVMDPDCEYPPDYDCNKCCKEHSYESGNYISALICICHGKE